MKLAEICEELTYTCLQGEMEKEISDIIYDSRKVEKDTVFVCMVGAVVDGHDFVDVTTRTMSKRRNRERIVILRKLRSLQVGGGNGRFDEFRNAGVGIVAASKHH